MSGFGALLAAGLLALAVAGLVDVVAGTRRGWRGVPYLLGALAAACLAGAGGAALAGRVVRLNVGGWLGTGGPLGVGTAGLAADRLSGLFLVISFGAAAAVSLAFAAWVARPGAVGRRGLGAGYALALGSVAVIVTAGDAFTLLLAWEALTVAFYLLAGFERGRPGRPGGAFATLAFGRLSGAALLAGLLLLAARSGSFALASFGLVPAGTARDTAEVLLIAGFAVKVGLVPFQVWLPRGYPAAPGPARAIMAGTAVNVGFYGLWRTLAVLGPPPVWLTGLLLVLAGLCALIGIAHAAVQPGLQRVIAYSSVENSGLIVAGYATALAGAAVREPRLAAAGLLAATLQIIAHTAAKSLMFVSSAVIAPRGSAGPEAPGDDDLDTLRGAARRLPWSGTGLAVGSLTLAGLPLTAGFAAEWFLLESLMQQFRVPGLGLRLALAVAGAAVALTAGFAGVTFVRLTGLVVLGPAPAQAVAGPEGGHGGGTGRGTRAGRGGGAGGDYGWPGRVAVAFLAVCCLAPAALLPLVIRVIAAGLAPVVPAPVTLGALRSSWVVQPVFSGFSILSPSWLWVVMPLMLLAVLAFTRLAAGTRLTRVRRVPAWRSATAGVAGADCYTATGFANPARRVLATVLHTQSRVRPLATQETGPGGAPAGAAGAPTRAGASARPGKAPGRAGEVRAAGPRLGYTSDVIEVVETYLYRPLIRPARGFVRAARRLQSGRLDAYLAYMLIALAALLALVAGLA